MFCDKTIQTIGTNDQDKRTDVSGPTSGNSNKLSIVGPLFTDMLICQRKKMSDRVPAANKIQLLLAPDKRSAQQSR